MFVYADNAATTSVSKTALDAMMPYLTEQYGNPSSLYAFGQKAKEGLEAARKTVAECINAEPREIYFTSGGSEADNQAIVSAAKAGGSKSWRRRGSRLPCSMCMKTASSAWKTWKPPFGRIPLLLPLCLPITKSAPSSP